MTINYRNETLESLAEKCRKLESRVKRLEAALTEIASWEEGPNVNAAFDHPSSAKLAREALSVS